MRSRVSRPCLMKPTCFSNHENEHLGAENWVNVRTLRRFEKPSPLDAPRSFDLTIGRGGNSRANVGPFVFVFPVTDIRRDSLSVALDIASG